MNTFTVELNPSMVEPNTFGVLLTFPGRSEVEIGTAFVDDGRWSATVEAYEYGAWELLYANSHDELVSSIRGLMIARFNELGL